MRICDDVRRGCASTCTLRAYDFYFFAEADGAGNCGNPLGRDDGNPLGNAEGNPLGNVLGKLLGSVEGMAKGFVAAATPPSVADTKTVPPSGSFFGVTWRCGAPGVTVASAEAVGAAVSVDTGAAVSAAGGLASAPLFFLRRSQAVSATGRATRAARRRSGRRDFMGAYLTTRLSPAESRGALRPRSRKRRGAGRRRMKMHLHPRNGRRERIELRQNPAELG